MMYLFYMFKKPSSYKKVDFKKHVEELWNTHISDDKDLDKLMKKNILNVLIGILGKSKK